MDLFKEQESTFWNWHLDIMLSLVAFVISCFTCPNGFLWNLDNDKILAITMFDLMVSLKDV